MTTLANGTDIPVLPGNTSVMVACDLDQTLIYSANSMALQGPVLRLPWLLQKSTREHPCHS